MFLNLTLGAIAVAPAVAEADEPTKLNAKPGRCVALRQGQNCYQKIKFTWNVTKTGYYCLYQVSHDVPLACWEDQNLKSLTFAFESTESETFVLKLDDLVIDETNVNVSWVYKSSKRVSTGWRLF